ncbi:hypothetical protein AOL_s00006g240 [Orbilia oligospora ATCC 24927]|uniref:3-carboxymuconate cyclase n=2 Tax=Orbilia oligospora TaxID=2813651 RepID=G1X039_ARTOA|nr:hypothetical protein AOL_s00006g240 [Orbilia oligospora ATCC 24927]EGX53374.1 hypothetical protein AOL_s00006g240 [Orbilia oligospora ATCC 24927]KAF3291203.1 hypothetical protein TWF970_000434 [Orbilia oligospora]
MYSKILNTGFFLLPLLVCTEAAKFALPFNTNSTAIKKLAAVAAETAPIQIGVALYFQTNPMGRENEIVACQIQEDGSIGAHKRYRTGGRGGAAPVATGDDNGKIAKLQLASTNDALFSQHSVIINGNYLFTVNAGSNSITMFLVDPKDPLKLTRVGKRPTTSHGDLPVSLAYSPKLNTLCVANSGKRDGVACYDVDPQKGLTCTDTEPLKRTIGTVKDGPAGTVSDMFFTDDQKNLIVITKGNSVKKEASIVDVYRTYPDETKKSKICLESVRSKISEAPLLFGAVQVSPTKIFATDGSIGVAKLTFDPKTLKVTLPAEDKQTIDFQSATGWIAKNPKYNTVYVTDGKMNRVIEFNSPTGDKTQDQSFLSGQPGNLDVAIGGDFLYTLSPSNLALAANTSMIQVMHITGKNKFQDVGAYVFDKDDDITAGAHGMAISCKSKTIKKKETRSLLNFLPYF